MQVTPSSQISAVGKHSTEIESKTAITIKQQCSFTTMENWLTFGYSSTNQTNHSIVFHKTAFLEARNEILHTKKECLAQSREWYEKWRIFKNYVWSRARRKLPWIPISFIYLNKLFYAIYWIHFQIHYFFVIWLSKCIFYINVCKSNKDWKFFLMYGNVSDWFTNKNFQC